MNKKLYTVTVHNTNTNQVHTITVSGRKIYGKSKVVFTNLEYTRFHQLEQEVLNTRFARMTIKITEIVGAKVVVESLSDDEKEVKKLLALDKYDEAKIILDKINTEANNKDNPDVYNTADDMNEDIVEKVEDVIDDKEEDNAKHIFAPFIPNVKPPKGLSVDELKDTDKEKEPIIEKVNGDIPKPDFDDMSKKELIKFAEENKIEVPEKINKKDLLEILISLY